MIDVVDAATRSRMMSGIRGVDTKPEWAIRSGLHRLGLRYRLHDRSLPGRPDLVLPKYRVVVLVHGCFWHGHDCRYFKWPRTRAEFWREKIVQNQNRDHRQIDQLRKDGWRVLVVWECAVRAASADPDRLSRKLAAWIRSGRGSVREVSV